MFIRQSSEKRSSRGQAMVEFALILPLLALLLVMAIDFGRVFFGWVGLQNATRIAANAAGSNPDAWNPPGEVGGQNAYRQAVLNDLRALNCERPGGGSWTLGDIPAPTFESKPTGFSADPYEVGDHAVVSISCEFSLITPLAEALLGQPVNVGARSEFMVRGGQINGIPIGPAPPPSGCVDKVVPNLVGLSVSSARAAWSNAEFTGSFLPATGSDTEIVTSQTTSPPSSPNDCLVATATVVVAHSAASTCSGTEVEVPTLTGLSLTQARTTWTQSGFDAGTFSPATGSDTNIVSGQTTSPSSTPGDCREPSTTVTVTHGAPPPPQCSMPELFGKRVNAGQSDFTTAGFTGTYAITRPPNGNYAITTQSLVGGQEYPCSSSVTVAGN